MRLRTLCLVVLVLGSVLAPSVAGSTAAAKPSVDVSIGSTTMADGDTYESGQDVDVRINASVGADASAGTTLDEIVVRVNGELDRTIAVDGANASETVRPDLANGDNSVRVIVTDEAGNVDATAFTVSKDGEAPHVYLTSPYETNPWRPIGDGTVEGTKVTLAGNVIEDSSVEKLRITREFDGDRSSQVVRDVGENFSTQLALGYRGNASVNDIRMVATDTYGNVQIYSFSIEVTDGAAPNVSLEPVPNETASNRVFLAGTVTDDIGVREANLTISGPDGNVTDSSRIVRSGRSGPLDRSRRSVSFNESVYVIYPGTYEATVTTTDVSGKTATRSVSIDRIRQSERDIAPEIAVDRGRTVVLGSERLFLSGVAFEGVTERLIVETRAAATGETLDYQVVHAGSHSERVEFDREVTIGANRTEVIVRATDADGAEHTERFFVDGSTRQTFVDEADGGGDGESDGDDSPTISVDPLRDGRAGTASASVTVRGAAAGDGVSIPTADGPHAVAATTNVSVDRFALSFAEASNLTATVVARERAGDPLDAPDGAAPAASVTVQHSVPDAALDGVEFDVTVRRAYLDAHGLDPANLSAYRLSGGNWSAVETTRDDGNDTHVGYRVTAPGLSVFSLASAAADGGDEPNGNGTDGNGTAADDSGDSGTTQNGTADNETASDDQSGADISVRNVTVNRTAVAVNESVGVNVTLVNEGDADDTYVTDLRATHEGNVSTLGQEVVPVPAGEERTVGFTAQFAAEGNHTVMVDDTRAGPVVVGSGGGLLSFLSFLSFLPLRLIGMAVGGIVGLLLVLVLLRFVLGKVGGGESASG